jgi:hypothetical protein
LQDPDQKRFFNKRDTHDLFESPPKPKEELECGTEELPKKRKRENDIIEIVINCDIKEYEEKSAIKSVDFCRMGEIQRMKEHAAE